MYFIFLKRKITLTNLLSLLGKLIINLFTWSKYHHVASSFYKEGKIYVGEAKIAGARVIEYSKFINQEKKHNKIFAFKAKKVVNPSELLKFHEDRMGDRYDWKAATNAVIELFEVDNNKYDCSEYQVILCQKFNLLPININASTISPKEFLKLLKEYDLIETTPEVWK